MRQQRELPATEERTAKTIHYLLNGLGVFIRFLDDGRRAVLQNDALERASRVRRLEEELDLRRFRWRQPSGRRGIDDEACK